MPSLEVTWIILTGDVQVQSVSAPLFVQIKCWCIVIHLLLLFYRQTFFCYVVCICSKSSAWLLLTSPLLHQLRSCLGGGGDQGMPPVTSTDMHGNPCTSPWTCSLLYVASCNIVAHLFFWILFEIFQYLIEFKWKSVFYFLSPKSDRLFKEMSYLRKLSFFLRLFSWYYVCKLQKK